MLTQDTKPNVMACHQTGGQLLPELMLAHILSPYGVTSPPWETANVDKYNKENMNTIE